MEMVVGFLFSEDKKNVLLINKIKPEWQRGKFNGIGGKVEKDEKPDQAMTREFFEESGLLVELWNLKVIAQVGLSKTLYFYYGFGNVKKAISCTEEQVSVCEVDKLPLNLIPNLKWIIPLCLDIETISIIEAKFLETN